MIFVGVSVAMESTAMLTTMLADIFPALPITIPGGRSRKNDN
jgi:hypothetical protein